MGINLFMHHKRAVYRFQQTEQVLRDRSISDTKTFTECLDPFHRAALPKKKATGRSYTNMQNIQLNVQYANVNCRPDLLL
jgi:hypothetical protein